MGILLSLVVSSWLLRENLVALVASQLSSLAEQIGAMVGLTGTPPLSAVYALLFSVVSKRPCAVIRAAPARLSMYSGVCGLRV